jgi:hypothetical protein
MRPAVLDHSFAGAGAEAQKALTALIQEAYIRGISPCSVDA